MKSWHKVVGLAAIALLGASEASARDQIKIVGSSTVFPFSSYVAEELGATTKYPTPVVESTGSGGGMKLFCEGAGLDTPDITNASRRMKTKEWDLCQQNGVKDITEAVIGYDGIAFAQSKKNKHIDLTREQIALAVAAEVPVNGKLVPNPYKKWSDIDKSLPNREIVIYGPPTTSGTRDAFEELVMEHATAKNEVYKAAHKGEKKFGGYKKIRQDGVYIPSGENDNLIVQKLQKNEDAFGIFGYSFLEENSDTIEGAKIEGFEANPENIASAKYPVSRSLFFYIKHGHMKDVPAVKAYVDLFMSEKMIGDKGILKTIGLIPLDDKMRSAIRKQVLSYHKLSKDMLKGDVIVK